MSKVQIQLCGHIIREHFGEVVEKVALYLMQHVSIAFRAIIRDVKEPVVNIKKSLRVLIHHRFVDVLSTDVGLIEYRININRIILILRHPKFIHVAKIIYGDCGEHIVEELLKEGQLTISQSVQRVTKRLASALSPEEVRKLPRSIYDVFVKLVEDNFIEKTCDVSTTSVEEQLKHPSYDAVPKSSAIPEIKLNLIKLGDEDESPTTKRAKLDLSQPDEGIYWTINVSRFHQHLRDMVIMDAIRTHYDDEKAVELVKTILKLTESKVHYGSKCTPGVSKQVICDIVLKQQTFQSSNEVDMYLNMFNDDMNNRFICKYEASAGGGMYGINIAKVLDKLFDYCVTSIVEDQFGSKMSRIFRLILNKRYLQQKQIEDTAMILSKDCKEMTYTLFKEGFVRTLLYPRQPDYAPSKTHFVFTVDRSDVSRNIIQDCYRALMNSIIRRNHEQHQNKGLIERKIFIDAVIANLKNQSGVQDVDQQIEDLNQSFSSHDRELLEKLQKISCKLELCESQVDETLFLVETWMIVNV